MSLPWSNEFVYDQSVPYYLHSTVLDTTQSFLLHKFSEPEQKKSTIRYIKADSQGTQYFKLKIPLTKFDDYDCIRLEYTTSDQINTLEIQLLKAEKIIKKQIPENIVPDDITATLLKLFYGKYNYFLDQEKLPVRFFKMLEFVETYFNGREENIRPNLCSESMLVDGDTPTVSIEYPVYQEFSRISIKFGDVSESNGVTFYQIKLLNDSVCVKEAKLDLNQDKSGLFKKTTVVDLFNTLIPLIWREANAVEAIRMINHPSVLDVTLWFLQIMLQEPAIDETSLPCRIAYGYLSLHVELQLMLVETTDIDHIRLEFNKANSDKKANMSKIELFKNGSIVREKKLTSSSNGVVEDALLGLFFHTDAMLQQVSVILRRLDRILVYLPDN